MRWKTKEYSEWHTHFTWIPTRVNGEWVWLERILRRGIAQLQTRKNKPWHWEFVNSEFDLIKMQEEKRKYAEDSGAIGSAQLNFNAAGIGQAKGLMPAAQNRIVSKAYVQEQLAAMKQPPTTGY